MYQRVPYLNSGSRANPSSINWPLTKPGGMPEKSRGSTYSAGAPVAVLGGEVWGGALVTQTPREVACLTQQLWGGNSTPTPDSRREGTKHRHMCKSPLPPPPPLVARHSFPQTPKLSHVHLPARNLLFFSVCITSRHLFFFVRQLQHLALTRHRGSDNALVIPIMQSRS